MREGEEVERTNNKGEEKEKEKEEGEVEENG